MLNLREPSFEALAAGLLDVTGAGQWTVPPPPPAWSLVTDVMPSRGPTPAQGTRAPAHSPPHYV